MHKDITWLKVYIETVSFCCIATVEQLQLEQTHSFTVSLLQLRLEALLSLPHLLTILRALSRARGESGQKINTRPISNPMQFALLSLAINKYTLQT